MGLIVEDVASDAAVETVRLADCLPIGHGDLRSQLTRAATSVVLNIAEGWGRRGGDATYHFRVAYGSAREVRAALRLVGQLGLADRRATLSAWQKMDRVASMLWPLTRPRS
jgi:four helix bundle protein